MRLLGKTNMKVNRVGFGGIPIQRITQEETNKVINELIDKNVNFIDTARAYTISEEYIGNAIEGKREKFFIATKSMARDYESMKQDIEISLKNLKTDYIDLYQIHNLKPEEYKTIFDENKAYKALLEAKEEGKIKYIGITSHSLETIEKSIEDEKFSTIQFPYNIIEDQADEVFKKANKKDIGIIISTNIVKTPAMIADKIIQPKKDNSNLNNVHLFPFIKRLDSFKAAIPVISYFCKI